MGRKLALLTVSFMVLLVGTTSVVNGQKTAQMESRTLLIELGNMLTEVPETEEKCQALLKRIKAWQQKRLKELETKKAFLVIIESKDGDSLPYRPDVKGTVADPTAEVWIIVHPMEVSGYWVQPRVTVKGDGTWKVKIYIGREGNTDVGKQYEIMAVANPKTKLREGMILSGWPEAQGKSNVIEVIRR